MKIATLIIPVLTLSMLVLSESSFGAPAELIDSIDAAKKKQAEIDKQAGNDESLKGLILESNDGKYIVVTKKLAFIAPTIVGIVGPDWRDIPIPIRVSASQMLIIVDCMQKQAAAQSCHEKLERLEVAELKSLAWGFDLLFLKQLTKQAKDLISQKSSAIE